MHNDVYNSKEGSSQHESAEKDHEMIQQQLNNIIANANQLLEKCDSGSSKLTEAWVQSKMTLADDYLDTVHSYVVNGGDAKPDTGQSGTDNVGFVIAVEKAMTKDGSSKT